MSVLRAEHITKDYPGTRALDDVSASFESGKINALLGKNGSGKSTLVKIIAGAESRTAGKIYYNDEPIEYKSPSEAHSDGVVLVYQETSLVPTLSVAENIFLGQMPQKMKGVVDWKYIKKRSEELLASMDLTLDLNLPVSHLPMWQRQVVEICKALCTNPKVLILDEPTSALAKNEVDKLFKAIRRIKENDVVIIYITHKLQEVHEIADTVTVLRDSKYIGFRETEGATNADIIHMMFGDVELRKRPAELQASNEVVMEVKNLCREGWYENISFKLYRGEVLGIAGMLGSGRTELLTGIFGSAPADSGEVYIDGALCKNRSPISMKARGVGLTPEDRKTQGLILMHSIETNLCYAGMKQSTVNGWVESAQKRRDMAQRQVDALQIKLSGLKAKASSMSGGNQQKVVVGNWLNIDPEIMIYDEPTRGIDVTAKQQIFEIMWDQSQKGKSSIFVSSELEELMDVCHRILIMRHGRLVDEWDSKTLEKKTINDLYTVCMGGTEDE